MVIFHYKYSTVRYYLYHMVLIYILNMVNLVLKYGIVRYYLYVTCYIQKMNLEESMLWNTFYIWSWETRNKHVLTIWNAKNLLTTWNIFYFIFIWPYFVNSVFLKGTVEDAPLNCLRENLAQIFWYLSYKVWCSLREPSKQKCHWQYKRNPPIRYCRILLNNNLCVDVHNKLYKVHSGC